MFIFLEYKDKNEHLESIETKMNQIWKYRD